MNKLLLLPLLYTLCVCSALYSNETGRGSLKFDTQISSLGRVCQGREFRIEFNYRNIGNKKIEIVDVMTTCACTVTNLSRKIILPNERGTINVLLKTNDSEGQIRRQILVKYKEGEEYFTRILEVQASIAVEGKLFSKPSLIYLGDVSAGTEIRGSLDLGVLGKEKKTKVLRVESPAWVVTDPIVFDEKKSIWLLKYRVKVPAEVGGELLDKITIKTDNTDFPVLSIPIIAAIEDDIYADPKNVIHVIDQNAGSSPIIIKIRDRKSRVLRFESIQLQDSSKFEVSHHENDEKSEIVVRLIPISRLIDGSLSKDNIFIKVKAGETSKGVRIPVLIVKK